MGAGDLIKALQKYIARRGPVTYRECRLKKREISEKGNAMSLKRVSIVYNGHCFHRGDCMGYSRYSRTTVLILGLEEDHRQPR